MNRGWFDQVVPIVLATRPNVVHRVNNAVQADRFLAEGWPIRSTEKHLAARRACVAVLRGQREAAFARRAFAEAAEEARILGVDNEPG